uniref:ATPase subunit 8 n=1 Tax=Ophiura luetkenii TaxID=869195 RepID=Q6Y408_OPHLU|nr:ATP synthase F0 subunit 8 [Ophiura luetkenii]AAO65631.1 ATPase subunit 8 [Ophiura luetkenii]
MPQLDFTIWLINLSTWTCWTMFFLVFTATNNITNFKSINETQNTTISTKNNNWIW